MPRPTGMGYHWILVFRRATPIREPKRSRRSLPCCHRADVRWMRGRGVVVKRRAGGSRAGRRGAEIGIGDFVVAAAAVRRKRTEVCGLAIAHVKVRPGREGGGSAYRWCFTGGWSAVCNRCIGLQALTSLSLSLSLSVVRSSRIKKIKKIPFGSKMYLVKKVSVPGNEVRI